MLDSRLLLLLLVNLLGGVISVSVEVEILTGRQLSAAVSTEERLAVFWCKSYNLSYWSYHPPLPSLSLAVDQIINCITPPPPSTGSMFASQIINLFLHGCDCYGSLEGRGLTSLLSWENKEIQITTKSFPPTPITSHHLPHSFLRSKSNLSPGLLGDKQACPDLTTQREC